MLEYHLALLSDAVRMQALRRAVHELVRPGDVVLDVGAGTGVLACFAAQAGAARVYAIEREDIIHLAREVVAANGFSDRIELLQCDAREARLPEPADVLLGELLGVVGLEENIVAVVRDLFVRGLVKPDARVLPRRLSVWLAPWDCPSGHGAISLAEPRAAGLDLGPVRALALNRLSFLELEPEGQIDSPQALFTLELGPDPLDRFEATATFCARRRAVLHGFGAWFEAELSPGVRLCTAPNETRTHWRQGFFPLDEAIALEPGDAIAIAVQATSAGERPFFGWSGRILRAGSERRRFRKHSFLGMLLPVSSLRVAATGALTGRSREGEILFHLLGALERGGALQDVSRKLAEDFPERFHSADEAIETLLWAVDRFGQKN